MTRPPTRPLSDDPLLEKLQRQQEASGLSIVDFADWVLGIGESTWHSWFRGQKISASKLRWIRRLERVEYIGSEVHITLRVEVRRGAIGPQHGRQLAATKRRRELEARSVASDAKASGGKTAG